jgi:hypothetical protein
MWDGPVCFGSFTNVHQMMLFHDVAVVGDFEHFGGIFRHEILWKISQRLIH